MYDMYKNLMKFNDRMNRQLIRYQDFKNVQFFTMKWFVYYFAKKDNQK